MIFRPSRILLGLALLLLGFNRCAAQEPSRPELYHHTLRSTVWAIGPNLNGTGWVIDRERRLVLTNRHIAQDAATAQAVFPIYQNGRVVANRSAYSDKALRITGSVVHREPRRDLALIQLERIPDGIPELKLAAQSATAGTSIHIVGNEGAAGCMWTYTPGRVPGVHPMRQNVGGITINCRVMDVQAPFASGDSGGPVVNDRGEIVAIISATSYSGGSRQFSGFCIDVSEIREFLAEGIKKLKEPEGNGTATRLEQAQALAVESDWDAALKELDEVLHVEPKNSTALRLRGLVFLAKDDRDKALADFTAALRANPGDLQTYVLRRQLNAKLGAAERDDLDKQTVIQVSPLPRYVPAANRPAAAARYHDTVTNLAWLRAGKASGAGVLIDAGRKLLVTTASLVAENQNVEAIFSEFKDGKPIADRKAYTKAIAGRVVYREPRADLAIVELEIVPDGAAGLKLAATSPHTGEQLYLLTNPGDKLWQERSAILRNGCQRKGKFNNAEIEAQVLLLNTSLAAGESGGALINDSGELAGIVSPKATNAPLLGCCIDAGEVKAALAKVKRPDK